MSYSLEEIQKIKAEKERMDAELRLASRIQMRHCHNLSGSNPFGGHDALWRVLFRAERIMARTDSQHVLYRLSCDDRDVFLQLPYQHRPIQLLVFYLSWYYGAATRYPLCATLGFLRTPSVVSCPLGAVALHAHLLLCSEKLAKLHQEQPVVHLHHRRDYCHNLQHRHLS